MTNLRRAALDVAKQLEEIAEREARSLKKLDEAGVSCGEFVLNYPTEQMALALRLRDAAALPEEDMSLVHQRDALYALVNEKWAEGMGMCFCDTTKSKCWYCRANELM